MSDNHVPGGMCCSSCDSITFRARADGLCPACALRIEKMIEEIELEGMERDLILISRFEAYCVKREQQRRFRTAIDESHHNRFIKPFNIEPYTI